MGDLVDITTVPKQKYIYYKLTSGSLRFQVKGRANAGIGFASRPKPVCDLWVVLGSQGCCTIVKKHDKQVHSIPTPHILSGDEFRQFWLQWHDDVICLGRNYAVNPFLVYREDTTGIKYLTFAVDANNSTALQWRFEMSPLREKPRMKSICTGIPQWVHAEDQLPDSALIGGYENEMLYIIRAAHEGSLTPGKFVPSLGVGYIPWGGGMHEKTEFEILVGYDCVWLPARGGSVPLGAVPAGHSEAAREPLYVGRARCGGRVLPGKVQPSHNVCYVPCDDREVAVKDYEVLVAPHGNTQCTNPFFMYDRSIWPTATSDMTVGNFGDGPEAPN